MWKLELQQSGYVAGFQKITKLVLKDRIFIATFITIRKCLDHRHSLTSVLRPYLGNMCWHIGAFIVLSNFQFILLVRFPDASQSPSSWPASGCLSECSIREAGWWTLFCRNYMTEMVKHGCSHKARCLPLREAHSSRRTSATNGEGYLRMGGDGQVQQKPQQQQQACVYPYAYLHPHSRGQKRVQK